MTFQVEKLSDDKCLTCALRIVKVFPIMPGSIFSIAVSGLSRLGQSYRSFG